MAIMFPLFLQENVNYTLVLSCFYIITSLLKHFFFCTRENRVVGDILTSTRKMSELQRQTNALISECRVQSAHSPV